MDVDRWMDVPGHPSVELEGQEVLDLDEPHEDAYEADDHGECLAELVELLFERRVVVLLQGLVDLRVDLANLGGHPGMHDEADGAAIDDGGAREHHAVLGLDVSIVGRHGVGRLVDGVGLAGELPLLDPEVRRDEPEDAHVGGDLVPYADHDDVPQDEVARGEGGRPLGTVEHGGVVGLDLAQRLERLLGVGLLPDPDGGVDDEDEEDDERLDEGRDRERAGRRGERLCE